MLNVLVIDDSTLARNLIRQIVVNEGYHVCGEASNGREGLEAFKTLKPDLVFCDIMMDEMDGLECLRAILAVDPAANVVICTSAGDALHIKEALEIGAKEVLPKPVNSTEIARIANELLGRREADRKSSYKALLEERASQKGIVDKQILDFYAAFHQFTGFTFEDERVDAKFLQENGPGIRIGVSALLSAKMSSDQAENMMNVFESLYL